MVLLSWKRDHQIKNLKKIWKFFFWKLMEKHPWSLTNSVKRDESGMSESLHYFSLLFERLGVHRPLAHLFDRNFYTLVPNTFPNLRKKFKIWIYKFPWLQRSQKVEYLRLYHLKITSPNMPFPRRWVSLISLWLISQTSLARPPVDWGSCICGHASPSLQLNFKKFKN